MITENYKNFLLSNIPSAKPVAGGREINCRCMYCGDSVNKNKGHFYISLPKDDGELSFFNCFKCPAQGIVTSQTLLEWGIGEPSMMMELLAHNKKAAANPNNRKYMGSGKKFNVKNLVVSKDKLSEYKLSYINNRLGTRLSFEDCLNEKIVLNLNDLLSSNHINELSRHPSIVECLDAGFIGFLSIDNGFVNMRNLGISKLPETIDKRYVNYNIFGEYDNTHRFYTSPIQIDLGSPNPIRIHLAEGPMDILSIKYNLRKEVIHNIYSSIGGNGYLGIIKYFIVNLALPNLEIHYYPDNDVHQSKILRIAELLRPFGYGFYIHRNTYPGQKDFGVSPDKIRESVTPVN